MRFSIYAVNGVSDGALRCDTVLNTQLQKAENSTWAVTLVYRHSRDMFHLHFPLL